MWQLDANGRYREVAKVTGDELYEAAIPYPVAVRPADLVRR